MTLVTVLELLAMDNLTHRRQGSSSQAAQEEPQYMDEHGKYRCQQSSIADFYTEQEDLIVTLHEQNKTSNVLYKGALIALSVLISIL